MYASFLLSGLVDLTARWLGAPQGTELVRVWVWAGLLAVVGAAVAAAPPISRSGHAGGHCAGEAAPDARHCRHPQNQPARRSWGSRF